jgi:hypothetical protein
MVSVVLVVDAANVVGSRPDGWWRDRAGAAARLVSRLSSAVASGALGGPVLVVLEGAARGGAPPGVPADGLWVVHAERDGDSAIVAQVRALVAEDGNGAVAVVTADRALRARLLAAGATVLGPSWLLDRLPDS